MKLKKAFTLIELLVVIAIIGILATVSVIALSNARAKSRDAKRVGDMKQIQTALELYFNDNGRYPTSTEWATGKIFSTSTSGTSTYLQVIPTAPSPSDGDCEDDQNTIYYQQTEGGSSYAISFCLGNTTGTLSSGPKCLTPSGIIDVNCAPVVPGFVCGVDTIDYGGGPYATIYIDNLGGNNLDLPGQCWMAKNINVGTQLCDTGDTCATQPDDTFSLEAIEKFCYINNLSYCSNYGALYTWAETMGLPNKCNLGTYVCGAGTCVHPSYSDCNFPDTTVTSRRGICPVGWHVPSDTEWITLSSYLGGDSVSGDKIKEVGHSHWAPPNGASNSSGLTALGAGHHWQHGPYGYELQYAFFWSSSLSSTPGFQYALYSSLYNSSAGFGHTGDSQRIYGYSVRCLRD